MGPHDLMCKWCSTFVGKGRNFCGFKCETFHRQSKHRKLPFKRPVYSSKSNDDREYVSPRSNKTAPSKKDSFLEDVITAMDKNNESPERDKRKPEVNGDASSTSVENKTPPTSGRLNPSTGSKDGESQSKIVPKLDLSSPKERKKENKDRNSARDKVPRDDKEKGHVKESSEKKTGEKASTIHKNDRSKTHTLLVHNQNSKLPVRNKAAIHHRSTDLNKTEPIKKTKLYDDPASNDEKNKRVTQTNETKKMGQSKEAETKDVDSVSSAQAAQRQRSKTAVEMDKRVRSSGYGMPINSKLRPVATKPRSATLFSIKSKQKREESAKSVKSSNINIHPTNTNDLKPAVSGQQNGNRELNPSTIAEETIKLDAINGNASFENDKRTPKSSPRKSERSDDSTRELAKIHEIIREESTHSDLLSQTELQLRLSSIKRKVEVRKRGRDSRSSYGSDLDSSFQDNTLEWVADKEGLNSSFSGTSKTSRSSARSNITRISKEFQSNTLAKDGTINDKK